MSYRSDFNDVQRQVYWTLPRIFTLIVVFLVLIYGLGFLATGGDLAIYKFWAPKQANAERAVFKQTQSYIDGKTTYLSRLRLEYETADAGHKAALRTEILTEASQVDESKLPYDLQAFIDSLKGN